MSTNAVQITKLVHHMPSMIFKLVQKVVVSDKVVDFFSYYLRSLIDGLLAVGAVTSTRPYTVLLISILLPSSLECDLIKRRLANEELSLCRF